ncbi:NAD(P)/FAD-dependent oxidoreductase [Streptomyces liangshanensis]|uniref:FAD-dependent oxidoreductase n=1 Tax=Streptomyces liangshanensis TaxID=2717324 RepID=A0A6G9HAM3_9ACTN|nr:FAD-dependent oxidoreductase [Streptomyces liangshanensis]QIQ07097.1 FAD-dependent oxidoreductase [Streptomyces liangshanensis]
MSRIVVVGASAAGLTAAEALRREGYGGRLTLVGDEPHLPYDRPPLSKQVLRGSWTPDRTALRRADHLDGLGARWLLGRTAAGLDAAARTVTLVDGEVLGYDGLVVATGVTPRSLPRGHELAGVHVLRTLDDALALREGLLTAASVVIVGAGFLGSEAAAVATELGADVTLVDPLAAPMIRQLGPLVGDMAARLHTGHGVRVRTRTGVRRLAGEDGRVVGVVLDDGSHVPADLVLVAIGSTPSVGWLTGSGLALGDGVECDELCRAAPGVVAAGDVASWHHPGLGRLRVEHRMNATEQGTAAALTLLGGGRPFAPVPYFWTDQYDVKIQAYGLTGQEATFRVVAGDPAEGRFAGLYGRAGRVVGALGWNMPREARTLRRHVTETTPWPQVMTPAGG